LSRARQALRCFVDAEPLCRPQFLDECCQSVDALDKRPDFSSDEKAQGFVQAGHGRGSLMGRCARAAATSAASAAGEEGRRARACSIANAEPNLTGKPASDRSIVARDEFSNNGASGPRRKNKARSRGRFVAGKATVL
jgi:hypothetical protein